MSEQGNPENDTQEVSSTEQETTDGSNGVSDTENSHSQSTRTPTEEELAFGTLSGSAQDRFRAILRERDEYREKLERASQAVSDRQSIEQIHTPAPTADNEVQEAVRKLKEVGGMATVDDLNQLYWAIENKKTHEEFEKTYNGVDGTPKYDRVEVEDYARRKGLGNNFLLAYRDMYWDELTDAKAVSKRKPIYTEKPTANVDREEPLSIDSIRKNLRGPNAQAYYDKLAKNPQEFTKLIEQLTTE